MPLIQVDVEAQTVKEQNYPQSNLNLASHALGKNTGAQGNGTFVPISIPKLDASFFHTLPALIIPLTRNCALSTPKDSGISFSTWIWTSSCLSLVWDLGKVLNSSELPCPHPLPEHLPWSGTAENHRRTPLSIWCSDPIFLLGYFLQPLDLLILSLFPRVWEGSKENLVWKLFINAAQIHHIKWT